MDMNWYAVGTFSGYEQRAKQLLEENIKSHHMEERFGEVLVPTEEVVELRGGVKKTKQRKLMPGYMFVQMALDSETWHVVKGTQKVIGFIGDDRHPKPISEREIKKLTQQVDVGTERPATMRTFEEGSDVRIVDGPFLNFSGVVEEVLAQKQKVRVLVSIFGRATPVELDFMQVERL